MGYHTVSEGSSNASKLSAVNEVLFGCSEGVELAVK